MRPEVEPTRRKGIGCLVAYLVLSYVLYWPIFYAMQAGVEWHASRHPDFMCGMGPPEVVAFLWFSAPVTTPILLLGALTYWVISPILDFIVWLFL